MSFKVRVTALCIGAVVVVAVSGCTSGALDPNQTVSGALSQLSQYASDNPAIGQMTIGDLLATIEQYAADLQDGDQSGQDADQGGQAADQSGQSEDRSGSDGTETDDDEPSVLPITGCHCTGQQLLLRETFNSAPFTATFTPIESGQTVTIVAGGNDRGSRLTLSVTDAQGNVVASVDSPTERVSHTTFTPADTGTYTLTATETGTAATLYAALIVQAQAAPPTPERRVLLLAETFGAAPFSATFTPTEAGRVIEVAAAGDNGSSRLAIEVKDPSGATVATVTGATTNVSVTTLESESTDAYSVTVTETGTSSTQYDLRVLERGTGGAGGCGFDHGHGWHRGEGF